MLLMLPHEEQRSAAFDDLVDRYESRVFNLIYRLIGDYDEAADLTQDTFVSAYRSFESFRYEASAYTWLYRIAVNVCKNKFRERDRRRGVEAMSLDGADEGLQPAESGLSAPLLTPERALEQNEMRRLVAEAIQNLPDDYRIVAVLRDLQGLSYREVAEAADLSIDVVKTRLARARQMLRAKLEHYVG